MADWHEGLRLRSVQTPPGVPSRRSSLAFPPIPTEQRNSDAQSTHPCRLFLRLSLELPDLGVTLPDNDGVM